MQKLISDVKEVNVRGSNTLHSKPERVGRDKRKKKFPSFFLPLGVFDTLILSIYSCDNFHYWGLPWIYELVSVLARVRNSGSTFQSIHCNLS